MSHGAGVNAPRDKSRGPCLRQRWRGPGQVLKGGKIVESGSYDLALSVEENGFRSYEVSSDGDDE